MVAIRVVLTLVLISFAFLKVLADQKARKSVVSYLQHSDRLASNACRHNNNRTRSYTSANTAVYCSKYF